MVTSDEQDLVCLERNTGQARWTRPRADTMYVAAVGDDTLLLVGEHRFTAIRAADGSHAWSPEFVAIPGGGKPCGRGLFDGRSFYLPTTDPELIEIRVEDGTVVRRQRVDERLGNLIAHRGTLIAQNESKVLALDSGQPLNITGELPAAAGTFDPHALNASELLGELSSTEFANRESATQELVRRRAESVTALAEGAVRADSEIALRSTAVLIALIDDGDVKVSNQAREALVSAAVALPRGVAENALARESEKRSPGARVELERLGAVVAPNGMTVTLPPTWRGGNDGLRHLLWLPQLESLELRHSTIGDEGLVYVRGLRQLKSLNLNRATISSRGLQALVELTKLETLLLQGTAVDDSAAEHLARLKRLKALNLFGTRFTPQGVEQLRNLLPSVQIVY
jgi:hypothetical protein